MTPLDDLERQVLFVAFRSKTGPTPEGGHRFTMSTEDCREIARALRALEILRRDAKLDDPEDMYWRLREILAEVEKI